MQKKPIVCDYIRLKDSSVETVKQVLEFMGQQVDTEDESGNENFLDYCSLVAEQDGIIIKTLEGDMLASIGDYIIKGINGEFYPVKLDIFNKTYEIIK